MEILELKDKEEKPYINILVKRKLVEWIAHNYVLSDHAQIRMIQKDLNDNIALKTRILESPLQWKTNNGCICIALNLYNYIVVEPAKVNEKTGEKYPYVVTFNNIKESNSNVIDRMMMTYKNFCIKGKIE